MIFAENIIMQICGIIGLLMAVMLFAATFSRTAGFQVTAGSQEDNDQIIAIRVIFGIMILGLMRGAF